jgi:hypothetical protein
MRPVRKLLSQGTPPLYLELGVLVSTEGKRRSGFDVRAWNEPSSPVSDVDKEVVASLRCKELHHPIPALVAAPCGDRDRPSAKFVSVGAGLDLHPQQPTVEPRD